MKSAGKTLLRIPVDDTIARPTEPEADTRDAQVFETQHCHSCDQDIRK
jgi:hypothetical protein